MVVLQRSVWILLSKDKFSIIFLCINVTKNQTQQNEILAIKLDFAADNTSMACRPLELGN